MFTRRSTRRNIGDAADSGGGQVERQDAMILEEGTHSDENGGHPVDDISSSSISTTPSEYVRSLKAYVCQQGLGDALLDLPEPNDYVFDRTVATRNNTFTHPEVLFLGQEDRIQVWAQLLTPNKKPDRVTYFTYDIDSGRKVTVTQIKGLPLMYPFGAFKNGKMQKDDKYLGALIRYVYRETNRFHGPLSNEAKNLFRVALTSIQKVFMDIKAHNIKEMHPPTVLPSAHQPTHFPNRSVSVAPEEEFVGPLPHIENGMNQPIVTPVPSILNGAGKRGYENDDDIFTDFRRLNEKKVRQREMIIERLEAVERQKAQMARQEEEIKQLRHQEEEIRQKQVVLLAGKDALWLMQKLDKYPQE